MGEKVSNAGKKIGGFFSKVWSKVPAMPRKLKGVTQGGEEFTYKVEHQLKKEKLAKYAALELFKHGTFQDVIKDLGSKSMLLYLSGNDDASRVIETTELATLDVGLYEAFVCFGLNADSKQGKLVVGAVKNDL